MLSRRVLSVVIMLSACTALLGQQQLCPENTTARIIGTPILQPGSELCTPAAVIPSFRVNEFEYAPAAYTACLASNGSGKAIIAWRDFRNGESDIYGRFIENGTPIGDDFKIGGNSNDFSYLPQLFISEAGEFTAAWVETISQGVKTLKFRCGTFGSPDLGDPVEVVTGEYFNDLYLTGHPNGNISLCWSQAYSDQGVYIQPFTRSGQAQSAATRIVLSSNNLDVIGISNLNDSSVMVAWTEQEGYKTKILFKAQKFSISGAAQGTVTVLNDTASASYGDQGFQFIAGNDEFLAFWEGYVQRINSDGTIEEAPGMLEASAGVQYDGRVAHIEDGKYCWAWHSSENTGHVAVFQNDNDVDGTPVNWNNLESCPQVDAAVYDGEDRILVAAYTTLDGSSSHIKLSTVNIQSGAVSHTMPVETSQLAGNASEPRLAVDTGGAFLTGWSTNEQNYRINRYGNDGTLSAESGDVDSGLLTSESNHFHDQTIRAFTDGSCITAWKSCVPRFLVYQYYDADLNPVGDNLILEGAESLWWYKMAVNAGNSTLFAWDSPTGIHYQVLNAAGLPQFSDLAANQAWLADEGWNLRNLRDALLLDDGSILLLACPSSRQQLALQRINADGSASGIPIVIDASDRLNYMEGRIFPNGSSGYTAFFNTYNGQPDYYETWICELDAGGVPLGAPVKISGGNYSAIDFDGSGNGILCFSGVNQIFGQRYQLGAGPDGDLFLMHPDDGAGYFGHDVKVRNGKIYLTYTSNRIAGRGNNIFATVLDYAAPTAVQEDTAPTTFTLSQAYPNPFNPETRLMVSLPAAAPVKVEIYDIRGRLVETLHDGLLSAGVHTMNWQAAGRPSGIYFCRLSSQGRVKVQKLVYQK